MVFFGPQGGQAGPYAGLPMRPKSEPVALPQPACRISSANELDFDLSPLSTGPTIVTILNLRNETAIVPSWASRRIAIAPIGSLENGFEQAADQPGRLEKHDVFGLFLSDRADDGPAVISRLVWPNLPIVI